MRRNCRHPLLAASAILSFALPLSAATTIERPVCGGAHETAHERNPAMGLTAQFCVLDGVRDGPYWINRLGGGLRLIQAYVDGKLQGPTTSWHANGKVASTGHYEGGQATGAWVRLNQRGEQIAKFTMTRGEGIWTDAWDNGALRARGPMAMGEKHGTWVRWRPSAKLRAIGGYRRGDRHGVWQFFTRTGRPNGTNVYDRGTGEELRWHDNGVAMSHGWVRHGVREGKWWWRHDNGQRSLSATYVRGQLHGTVVGWHLNGQRASALHYDKGKEHGLERRWTHSGVLLVERHWRDGRADGMALYFDHRGTLRAATCFDSGRIVAHHSDLEFATTPRARRLLKRRGRIDKATTDSILQAARLTPCTADGRRSDGATRKPIK